MGPSMEVTREPKIFIKVKAETAGSGSRTVALSPIDLSISNLRTNVVYAFDGPVPADVCSLLENGLRDTLEVYQEVAGRLCEDSNGRRAIDLSGAGAGWITAQANFAVRDLMMFNMGPEMDLVVPPAPGEELLLVQVTVFTCGGIAVSTTMHHSVLDGTGASVFMHAWATAVGRKITGVHDDRAPLPSAMHYRSALIPANPTSSRFEHLEYKHPPPRVGGDEYHTIVPLKLHFEPKQLETLKAEAMKNVEEGAFFTTFQCLTAHIWRCITRARGVRGETKSKVIVDVNGRAKLKEKLPENYIGNAFFLVHAQAFVKDLLEKPLSFAADKVRQAIKRVDDEYISSVLNFIELQQKNSELVARPPLGASPDLYVSSWIQMKPSDTNFGWGTPFYCGLKPLRSEGHLFLLPSCTSDGSIDAYVGVLASQEEKFLEYAFHLPSVKDITLMQNGLDHQ